MTGFAWEDVAGTPIIAGAVPEPSAVWLGLAAGAAGLLGWRRSRTACSS